MQQKWRAKDYLWNEECIWVLITYDSMPTTQANNIVIEVIRNSPTKINVEKVQKPQWKISKAILWIELIASSMLVAEKEVGSEASPRVGNQRWLRRLLARTSILAIWTTLFIFDGGQVTYIGFNYIGDSIPQACKIVFLFCSYCYVFPMY